MYGILKEPLDQIISYSKLNCIGTVSDFHCEFLQIESWAKLLRSYKRDIRDYLLMEKGDFKIEPKQCKLDEFSLKLALILQSVSRLKKIKLNFEKTADDRSLFFDV